MGGEMPISYFSISQYARDFGIVGDEFGRFHRLLTAIDGEWLAYRAESKPKPEHEGAASVQGNRQ